MLLEVTSNAVTGAVGSVVEIFTTNVMPLVTSEPIVYFLGAGLVVTVIGVFRKLRSSVH